MRIRPHLQSVTNRQWVYNFKITPVQYNTTQHRFPCCSHPLSPSFEPSLHTAHLTLLTPPHTPMTMTTDSNSNHGDNNNNNIINTSLPHRPRISPTNTDINMAQSHQGPPSPRSPHSPSLSSLQAAATLNAGLRSSTTASGPGTPVKNSIERRRSSLLTNFALNDPTIPAPGEMQQSHSARSGRRSSVVSPAAGDDPQMPHHHRQPSLGEMYQDMEIETEGRVNRLLHMIRLQQDQLTALQNQNNQTHDSSAIAPTPPTSTSRPSSAHPQDSQHQQQQQPAAGAAASTNANSRSTSFSSAVPMQQTGLPHGHGIFNRPHSLSRQSSARISNNASGTTSPALHPSSGLGPLTEDFLLGGTRDDAAFYQAETMNLTKENQLLKHRIKELG
jgi:hypothetical protein